jgi:hypothetical protein
MGDKANERSVQVMHAKLRGRSKRGINKVGDNVNSDTVVSTGSSESTINATNSASAN